MLPKGDGAERVPCPWLTLPAFTPAAVYQLGGAVPALALGARFHRAMRGAPRCLIGGLNHEGKLLEHRFEPLQQPALVTVAQGELHLAAGELDVDVDTRWRFRQRRGGDRWRSLRWDRGCIQPPETFPP